MGGPFRPLGRQTAAVVGNHSPCLSLTEGRDNLTMGKGRRGDGARTMPEPKSPSIGRVQSQCGHVDDWDDGAHGGTGLGHIGGVRGPLCRTSSKKKKRRKKRERKLNLFLLASEEEVGGWYGRDAKPGVDVVYA